jgi:Holliday junction resolvase RusA-like endonuclease
MKLSSIALRDFSRDYAEEIQIPSDIKKKFKHLKYDKCLKIVLHGDPISDERVRHNNANMGRYSPSKPIMEKIFGELYNKSPLLQNTVILSPFHMKLKFYMKTTKVDLKFINKANKEVQRLYNEEKLGHMDKKDVDNMAKCHNDILFDSKFFVTIDDGFNLGLVDPEKYISADPRVEIEIYYASNPNAYYKMKVLKSAGYFLYLISIKNMIMNKRTSSQQLSYLKKVVKEALNDALVGSYRSILRRACAYIEENYSSALIKEMTGLPINNSFNKKQASYKLMLLLTKGNKIATKIIESGGMAIEL